MIFPGNYPKFHKQMFVRYSDDRYFVKDTTTCSVTEFFENFDKPRKRPSLQFFKKSFNVIYLKICEFSNLQMRKFQVSKLLVFRIKDT